MVSGTRVFDDYPLPNRKIIKQISLEYWNLEFLHWNLESGDTVIPGVIWNLEESTGHRNLACCDQHGIIEYIGIGNMEWTNGIFDSILLFSTHMHVTCYMHV